MPESPYATLEIPVDADDKTIRAAYRHLASLHHPDRGGDGRRMQEINAAFDLLMDPERRAAWDAQGDAAERELLEDARRVLSMQLGMLIENEQVGDVVAALRQNLMAIEKNARVARAGNQLKERYYAKRLRAFKTPSQEGDFLRSIIESKLADLASSNKDCDRALASLEIANKILDGYSYEAEVATSSSPSSPFAQADKRFLRSWVPD